MLLHPGPMKQNPGFLAYRKAHVQSEKAEALAWNGFV